MMLKNKRYSLCFMLFLIALCMAIPVDVEAARWSYGDLIMRPGETYTLQNQDYAGATSVSKYWWVNNDTCVAITGSGRSSACPISALAEGKTIVFCRTNATQVTTVYNPVTNTYDSTSTTYTRTVNYNIKVEGVRTLTFDGNGGKASTNTMTIYTCSEIGDLPTATRSGYEFLGWYTEKTGGTKVDSTSIFSSNKTLYAQWKKINLSLSFDGNGGKASKSVMTIKNGNSVGTLPTAKRKGYLFDGWYTSKNGGNKISSSTAPNDDTTYYARWTKVTVGKCSVDKPLVGLGKMTVSFESVSGAQGYELYYSQNSKMKKAKKRTIYNTEVLLKNLKKGKTYYVRVRAYKKDSMDKKVYGSYSKIKKVKLPLAMLDQSEMTMLVGQKIKRKLNGAKGKITWTSNKKSIATVSKMGVVTAKKSGNVVITAKNKGKKYKCKIKVEAPGFAKTAYTFIKGKTQNVGFTGTTFDVAYKSSNTAVATVDAKGNVKAIAKGTTTISAIVNNKTYTCTVSVEAPYLSVTSKTLKVGEGFKLALQGTSLPVTWKSSNTGVASVSSNGTVSALAKGSTTIVATVNGMSYSCNVVVQQLIPGTLVSPYNASETHTVWVYKDGACKGDYTITMNSQVMYFEGDTLKLEMQFSITAEGGIDISYPNETGYAKDIIDLSNGLYDSNGNSIAVNVISNDTLEQELSLYEPMTFQLELELQGTPEGSLIYRIPTGYNGSIYTYTYFVIY